MPSPHHGTSAAEPLACRYALVHRTCVLCCVTAFLDVPYAGSAGGTFPKGTSLPMFFGVAESNGRRNYMQVGLHDVCF